MNLNCFSRQSHVCAAVVILSRISDADDGTSGTLIYGNVVWHPNPGFAPVHGKWNRGKGVKYWGVCVPDVLLLACIQSNFCV